MWLNWLVKIVFVSGYLSAGWVLSFLYSYMLSIDRASFIGVIFIAPALLLYIWNSRESARSMVLIALIILSPVILSYVAGRVNMWGDIFWAETIEGLKFWIPSAIVTSVWVWNNYHHKADYWAHNISWFLIKKQLNKLNWRKDSINS